MDKTNVFKATVKALKSRQKTDNPKTISNNNNNNVEIKKDEDFNEKAKNVVENITKLKDFLLLHRKEYVCAGSHLLNGSKMEDSQRDQIDQDSEKIIRMCQETIKHFKQEANAQKVLPQVRQHRDGVFLLIEAYLKAVCKMYSEQRAVRVKRVVDQKRISRLEPELRFRGGSGKKNFTEQSLSSNVLTSSALEKDNDLGSKTETATTTTTCTKTTETGKTFTSQIWEATTTTWTDEEEELSNEEAQMFEKENQALVEEMNSVMSEVKEIEGKVVEVSRLQEIFAEKVWDQEKEIDQISHVVAGTSENIISGNEQIREAMKNNAGFRVWILFFLVVCTFALLFLDWYNE